MSTTTELTPISWRGTESASGAVEGLSEEQNKTTTNVTRRFVLEEILLDLWPRLCLTAGENVS
jgi:hypothetical protein